MRLGKTAPNPFLSTFRYFREEYEAHIKEKKCPALVCRKAGLLLHRAGEVQGVSDLPQGMPCRSDRRVRRRQIHVIDQEKCDACGICFEVCPSRFEAVTRISGEPVPPPMPEDKRAVVRESKRQ